MGNSAPTKKGKEFLTAPSGKREDEGVRPEGRAPSFRSGERSERHPGNDFQPVGPLRSAPAGECPPGPTAFVSASDEGSSTSGTSI